MSVRNGIVHWNKNVNFNNIAEELVAIKNGWIKKREALANRRVTINWAKFPMNVSDVPAKRLPFGKNIIRPANSPSRLGVAIEKEMPRKIAERAVNIEIGAIGFTNNCHFLASRVHCKSIKQKTNMKRKIPFAWILCFSKRTYDGKSGWLLIWWITLYESQMNRIGPTK